MRLINKKKYRKFDWSILIYLIGIIIILYPMISNQYYHWIQNNIMNNYYSQFENIDMNKFNDTEKERLAYNKNLSNDFGANITMPDFNYSLNLLQPPTAALLPDPLGIIIIPKINVKLPIFFGTENIKLQYGTGVIEGTSLPTGGIGTHSVITGHRGLPTAKLFTDLPKLKLNDKFYIKTLNKTMAYQVDNIEVVEPDEIDSLYIDPNEDYVTLLTCTPYMINSHRLLVRGTRVELVESDWQNIQSIKNMSLLWLLLVILLFIVLFYIIYRRNKKRSKQ